MPPRMALSWTASLVRVVVDASGTYSLPYSEMRVILPRDANGGMSGRTESGCGTEDMKSGAIWVTSTAEPHASRCSLQRRDSRVKPS